MRTRTIKISDQSKEKGIVSQSRTSISVYNTCTLLLNEKYVNANLDAPDNAISGNEPSLDMVTCQGQIPE